MISRIANWILYAVILAVIGALIYYYTDWFKPATQKAAATAKNMVESIPVGPFGKKSDELLNQGREAFARGDAEGAIRAYQEFVKKNPDSVDGHGELGNVYYMTGRLQEASQSFYEAAKRMIEQGQTDRAQALLPSIGQGNAALANELQQKLAQAQPQQQGEGQPMQGQMPMQQGQMPPQMMPPGQMGQMPPGQMPPGQQGQMPQMEMPQGQMPQQGQMPPPGMPPVPQGQMPPMMQGQPGMPMEGQPGGQPQQGRYY